MDARLDELVVISIHALRVEGDKRRPHPPPPRVDISIHALRVEGDRLGVDVSHGRIISIHALRVEGDVRLPARRGVPREHISIHALRVEGDRTRAR